MKLNWNQKKKLISFFPKIELTYIKNIHKKIYSDVYLLIPKGQKFFAWFKCWNNKNVCFFFKLKNKTIQEIYILDCCFDYKLCSGKGTILYGTMIKNKTQIFCIEDIFYYKNKNINFENFKFKLTILHKIFNNDIKQIAYKKNDIIFSLPVINRSYETILKKIQSIKYPLYCIQLRKLNNSKTPYLNLRIKHEIKLQAVFQIRTCIEEDLYELYYISNNKITKYNYAYIPDFKTSVYMNSLFRNIRENSNLDLLEESDDEDEFENISIDKYVHLEKRINILCEYSQKMKLWKPIKISTDNIVNENKLYNCEKI